MNNSGGNRGQRPPQQYNRQQNYSRPTSGYRPVSRETGGVRQNPYRMTPPKPRKKFPVIQLIVCLIAVAFAVLFVLLVCMNYKTDYGETVKPITSTTACEDTATIESLSVSDIPETTVETTAETEPPLPSDEYDFSSVVPESEEEPLEVFAKAAFIGDSRTVGLIKYTKLQTHDYSSVGLNIGVLTTKKYIRVRNDDDSFTNMTLLEVLERDKDDIDCVYMALGLNELGWDPNMYIKTYTKVIGQIREIVDVPIYLQLILPMTDAAYEASEFGVTNDDQIIFNQKLTKMAEDLKLFLLDPCSLFELEDGTLDPADASDGIHLNAASYRVLLNYYQTHRVDVSKYKNIETGE